MNKKSYKKSRRTRKYVKKLVKKVSKRKGTKKYSKYQVIKPVPTGFSHSSLTVTHKPGPGQKLVKYIGQSSVFDNIGSWGFTSSVNGQGIQAPPVTYLFSGSAIVVLANSAMRYLDSTGLSASRPTIQAGQRNFKILLEQVTCESSITNASSANVTFDIYWLLAKTTKEVSDDPGSDFVAGLADENIGVSGAVSAFNIGCNPLQVKRFNINWNVLKKTSVSLGVGRSHTDCMKFKPNRYIDTNYADQFDQIRGISTRMLIISRGTVCDNNQGQAPGTVAVASAKLLGVTRGQYKMTVVSDTPKHYAQTNNLIDPGILYVKEEDGDVINAALAVNFA